MAEKRDTLTLNSRSSVPLSWKNFSSQNATMKTEEQYNEYRR